MGPTNQTDRQTDRQRNKETKRQRDRETEKQRDRETERGHPPYREVKVRGYVGTWGQI